MNILFVHEEYPEETNFGGIATYQKVMATELAKRGHHIYVICRGMKKTYHYIEEGVHIFRIFDKNYNTFKGYFNYRKKVAKKILKIHKKYNIDLIETPDWGAETIFLRKKINIPIVVRLHTPLKVWLKYNNNNFGQIKNYMLKWEEKNLLKADLVTCCSNFLKSEIEKNFSIKNKIEVIYNPMNNKNFYCDKKVKKEDSLLFVGSLEERKGILVLAKALNIIFHKQPNLIIKFIGKDTNRNSYNKSTKQVIYSLVEKQYHKNLCFLGQLPNNQLNQYYNNSRVAIFPSLFDNLPYVVLEAMSTGIYVIGSKNSGMIEMIKNNEYIYNTADSVDLAEKVLHAYKKSLSVPYNIDNINNVHQIFNPEKICDNMMNLYKNCISEFAIKKVLKKVDNSEITGINQIHDGIANEVYKVETKNNKYIVKRYLYQYDFSLGNELCEQYESNNIKTAKPINNIPIMYNGYAYNIFIYQEGQNGKENIDISYFSKLLTCERKTAKNSQLISKCDSYFIKLRSCKDYKKLNAKQVELILNTYEKLREKKIFYEKYLNHGDISKSNIICNKTQNVLIDFDETIVTTKLYDFAVIVIKNFIIDGKIDLDSYNQLYFAVKDKMGKYSNQDYLNAIKLYLVKILLEKFYLHCINKINLFDKHQLKDNYINYYNLLIDGIGGLNE